MKDWPLLLEAIDKKIEEQGEFIEWWTKNVRRPGQGRIIAERGYFSVDQANDLTGITPQQVSRWRKFLKDTKKYTERLRAAAYRSRSPGQG